MSMYGKNHYNICKVISLQLIKINGKKKLKKKNQEQMLTIMFSINAKSKVKKKKKRNLVIEADQAL